MQLFPLSKTIVIALLAMLFLLVSTNLLSQSIVTDRPDQTESSSTIAKGSLQIESGLLWGFSDNGFSSASLRHLAAPSTLFRVGIINCIELRVFNQFESIKLSNRDFEASGFSDLELGTKIQLLKKDNINMEIALLSHAILPTGSQYLSLEEVGTINKLCISHALTESIGLGYNVGYNYFGFGDGDLTYSLALGFGINDKASVYIEPYGDFTEFEDHVSNFDAGFTYLLKENFQVDFSFGTGINHTMNYLSAGFSWQLMK